MSAGVLVNEGRPCRRIVNAVRAELSRQMQLGLIKSTLGPMDEDGCVHVNGTIDLAALAHATEMALRLELFR